MNQLAIVTSVEDFFRDEVERIAIKHGLQLNDPIKNYVKEVLVKFVDHHELKLSHPRVPEKSLSPTEFWLETQQLPFAQQMMALQYLGDYSLFTTGFFGENIKKSCLDMDYFQSLGGKAYQRAGEIRESIAAERALNVFFTMSESFTKISELISEIFDQTMLHDPERSLKLFERWQKSGSSRLARLLVENGFSIQSSHFKNSSGSQA